VVVTATSEASAQVRGRQVREVGLASQGAAPTLPNANAIPAAAERLSADWPAAAAAAAASHSPSTDLEVGGVGKAVPHVVGLPARYVADGDPHCVTLGAHIEKVPAARDRCCTSGQGRRQVLSGSWALHDTVADEPVGATGLATAACGVRCPTDA